MVASGFAIIVALGALVTAIYAKIAVAEEVEVQVQAALRSAQAKIDKLEIELHGAVRAVKASQAELAKLREGGVGPAFASPRRPDDVCAGDNGSA